MAGFGALQAGIGFATSLAGIDKQQELQRQLMHENSAINLEQWERENKYNSPVEQMRRLRAAGLNPDLVYGGNVANTAGSAQLTDCTPQAPGAANAYNGAVRNALDASLVVSEREKNESEANRNNAQASDFNITAKFKVASFDEALRSIWLQNNFTVQQQKESAKRCEQIDMFMVEMSSHVSEMNSITALNQQRWFTERWNTKMAHFNADLAEVYASRANEQIDKTLDKIDSEIGLNEANKRYIGLQSKLLFSTMGNMIEISGYQRDYWFHHANHESALNQYMRALGMQVEAQTKYLPFAYAEAMFQGSKFYEHDKHGNLVYDKNGMPKVNMSFANYMKAMDQIDVLMGVVSQASSAYRDIAIGTAAFRGGKSKGNGDSDSVEQLKKLKQAYSVAKSTGNYTDLRMMEALLNF